MNKDRMTACYSRRRQALLKVMLALTVLILTTECLAAKTTIRVGHFPNATHAQGLVAHASWRQGKGWFEKRLGPDVTIQWFVYNAGPSAMEAILAKSIDLAYVNRNPTLRNHTILVSPTRSVEGDQSPRPLIISPLRFRTHSKRDKWFNKPARRILRFRLSHALISMRRLSTWLG